MNDSVVHPTAKDLMTPRVYTLPSTASFGDLISEMFDKHVSAIIITHSSEKGRIEYYLISHSDVVEFLYHNYKRGSCPDIYGVKLEEIMKGPIGIIEEETPIDRVIEYMNVNGYKRVLVGKGDIPTGIVSVRDILAWNNRYFRIAKPIMVMVMDNATSIILGKYLFEENFPSEINQDLIELYGGALNTISNITEEIFRGSGNMRVFQKDNYAIIFEPNDVITGILISDNVSIELRRNLHIFVEKFMEKYGDYIRSEAFRMSGKPEIDLSEFISVFAPRKI